jgi:conjugative relaxase-like TrwC/TraI family protein
VLTVTQLSNAEYLISSVALSIDEYYAGVGESPGVWAGRWAKALGLEGVVEAGELRALVDGKHPKTGASLLSGLRPRSVLAFDLTFSSPKSVSLLWALGSDSVADVVASAHREAVAVALEFLEEHGAVARAQSNGVRRRVATLGWVVAGFVHRTSREGDPQLHTHCLVPNLVCRAADGRYVAFDGGPLFEWGRAAGSIYQNHLQQVLSERLGVEWGPEVHNTREMEGFTPAQLRAFSKRSVQIETELEAKGALYESSALRMQADDEASLATRTAKVHSLTPSLLAGRWQEEAEAVGLPVGADLDRLVCGSGGRLAPPGWDEIVAILVDPEVGLCSMSARFTKADVVEHICAISGGRLATDEITALADRFVESDLVVRLTPDGEAGRRRAAQWSTVAHRALEDRTLALMNTLAARPTTSIAASAVDAALAGAPSLGEDQVAAVGVLAGEGGSLRAVLSPAGYGKTTMLHTAARAVAGDGRPVLGLATTAKAVAELAGAGLDARTIARLHIDLSDGPLAAGTVVVLDEISQTPTDQVEAVLAAVDACPGGSIWVLGDPRQSQPVGAGGAADHIETLAAAGVIPSARLTMNRRQIDPADRAALDLLRSGDPIRSQKMRAGHGWEHEHANPNQTRQAMTAAVCADIGRYGAEAVSALVVSHTDAEDLADLIRSRLAALDVLSGPAMTGPGWTTDREYRAGDRVLLHARYGPSGSRLINGTTATVIAVNPDGLAVRPDSGGDDVVLPTGFVTGTRRDGAPNVSHAWVRTVDGAQGGTWEACHLLGSAALDAYRGYTGQSRSRQPTHTWNTTQITAVDHGGVLADRRDGAEQVADALARQPDTTMAARSDPWTLDRQLRELIAEHERVLAGRPADRHKELAAAEGELAKARGELEFRDRIVGGITAELEKLGGLAGLSRRGRDQRRRLNERLEYSSAQAAEARGRFDEVAGRVRQLQHERDAYGRFERSKGWRRADLIRAREQLDHHWAEVVSACVVADEPLAYGIDKLRRARTTIESDRQDIDAGIPDDRADQWRQARWQLPELIRQRHQAEEQLAAEQARLQDAGQRRWGRHDHDAIADAQTEVVAREQQLQEAVAAEGELRERLALLAQHQKYRQRHIAEMAPHRREVDTNLARIDAALDCTRPDRVAALAENPPEHLVDWIGPTPQSPAGRAVWCHYALNLEAARDRNDGHNPPWAGRGPEANQARYQMAIADRVLQAGNDRSGPSEWAELANNAAAVLHEVLRARAAKERVARRALEPFPTPWIDPAAHRPEPGMTL